MKLLAAGGISDEPHMKDALSRVIVEMVKREWPQQWPGLLSELSEACSCGEIQTELVLLVFLRLVEDVALLQVMYICNINRITDFCKLVLLNINLQAVIFNTVNDICLKSKLKHYLKFDNHLKEQCYHL